MPTSDRVVRKFRTQLADMHRQYEQVRHRLSVLRRQNPRDEDRILQAEFELEMLSGGIQNLEHLIRLHEGGGNQN